MAETYIRPCQGQNKVDGTADDVIAPCLAVISVLSLGQRGNALLNAVPLLISTRASALGYGADLGDAQVLEVRICDARGDGGFDPGVQAGDPSVVLED